MSVTEPDTFLRNLTLFVEERDDRGAALHTPDRSSPLAEFLALCARSLSTELAHERQGFSSELLQARDVFVQAGLEALATRQWRAGHDWIQIGIRPAQDVGLHGELCRHVARVVRRLLSHSAIDSFFYMNKPPGMRLRFRTAAAGSAEDLEKVLYAEVVHWRAKGLVDYVEPGVYEPESLLFGGPSSMSFVHALFTVDSLIWLDYHSCRANAAQTISPAWLVSLALLRTLFAGLDITGWEDIAVWEHIRTKAGRYLGRDAMSLPISLELAKEIRSIWRERDLISGELHPAAKAIVAHHDSALLVGAEQWRTGYFCRPNARIGPRAAAALYVIFHWNRAALSSTEQALLAESLSERMLDDDSHR